MAKGDVQTAGVRKLKPNQARIAKRVADFEQPEMPATQEARDGVPKEVQPLNAGFFALEAMRYGSVERSKVREE